MTANANPLPREVEGLPRRCRLDLQTPAERAIWDAVQAVELVGADPLLTDAVIKLQEARTLLADWLEGGQKPEPPRQLTLQEQIAHMRDRWPQATVEERQFSNGPYAWVEHLVTIPDFPLPPGYNRAKCTVYFVVPSGYPFQPPERFYTDKLYLENGDVPYQARVLAEGTIAEKMGSFEAPTGTMIWFWTVDSWNHIQNTLRTYVSVIDARLRNVHAGYPRST